jgi:hypothetical protein
VIFLESLKWLCLLIKWYFLNRWMKWLFIFQVIFLESLNEVIFIFQVIFLESLNEVTFYFSSDISWIVEWSDFLFFKWYFLKHWSDFLFFKWYFLNHWMKWLFIFQVIFPETLKSFCWYQYWNIEATGTFFLFKEWYFF